MVEVLSLFWHLGLKRCIVDNEHIYLACAQLITLYCSRTVTIRLLDVVFSRVLAVHQVVCARNSLLRDNWRQAGLKSI